MNFLIDEEKICKRFIIDKDTASMTVPMIAILVSLFALAINQNIIYLQLLFAIAIVILLILRFFYMYIENNRSSKPISTKY